MKLAFATVVSALIFAVGVVVSSMPLQQIEQQLESLVR
jgi:hypothetical protein